MLPRSFYFLRHGETDWNVREVLQGHTDIPLNENGRAQAEQARQWVRDRKIDRIVTSSLSRAHDTAKIVNMEIGCPIIVDENLKERHFGSFEGLPLAEVLRIRNEMATRGEDVPEENGYPCPPGGETYAAFKTRVFGAMAAHLNNFSNDNVMFVAHGGIYRVLSLALFGAAQHSANARPFYFNKDDGDKWFLSDLTG